MTLKGCGFTGKGSPVMMHSAFTYNSTAAVRVGARYALNVEVTAW